MTIKFKAGMYVYYPEKTKGQVHELVENKSEYNPIRIDIKGNSWIFSEDGKSSLTSEVQVLFEATPENRELLGKLYGIEFEAPPALPTPCEIIESYIERDGFCWCGVSKKSEDDARKRKDLKLRKITRIFLDSAYPYEEKDGTLWSYAVPFAVKSKEITELPS